MSIEDQLRERLRKVEPLYFGASTAGERQAAGAAADRLKARLDEIGLRDPPIEMKFSLPDQWLVRLFIALRPRYGVRPYRYPRQRSTVMVKAPRQLLKAVIWRQFRELHADLWAYLEQTTERLIQQAVHADTRDAETAAGPASLP